MAKIEETNNNNKIYSVTDISSMLTEMDMPSDVARIYLFGSYARNQATENSDLDLYVEYEPPRSGWHNYGLMIQLEDLFQKPIDIVINNDLINNPLLEKLLSRDRKLVYERRTIL